MAKIRFILSVAWLFIFIRLNSQPVTPPDASVVYPQVGNSSFYSWILLSNPAYVSCIDTQTNLPIWVSHAITKEVIEYGETVSRERPDNYDKDNRYKVLKKNAYKSSGYDHGHMAPAADFKWDEDAFNTSFLMTNMAPQHGCLNQKGWCHLEALCREWAKKDNDHIVYIVSGIIPGSYIDSLCINKKLKVYVPAKFYKAVLYYDKTGTNTQAVGFIVDNNDLSMGDIGNYVTTIDQIEKMTSLELFSFLPDDIEEQIESVVGNLEIITTYLECPDKDCSSVYSGNRKLPEERTKLWCE
jgi:endonuclease G